MSEDPKFPQGAPESPYPSPAPDAPQQQWQAPPGAYVPGYPPPGGDYWSGYGAGAPPPAGYVPSYPGPMAPSTSGWAIASLILAICGWTVLPLLGSIAGVVSGHIALHEIGESQGRIEGRGFAVAGLIIGYAGIALLLCAAVAAIVFIGAALSAQ